MAKQVGASGGGANHTECFGCAYEQFGNRFKYSWAEFVPYMSHSALDLIEVRVFALVSKFATSAGCDQLFWNH